MDLNEMKNRLASLQSKQSGKNSGEKKQIFWKPTIGKQTIRIVPNLYNKDNPFTEMYFYYGIGKNTMASPVNWKEKDPIMEFAKELRKTSDKENWRLAKKLDPKMRIFVPIVVRGEESEGVKLWQFGKELYMDFLNLADNEDIGEYDDIMEGRDISLTTVGPEVTGTAYNKTSIMPKVKQTPLADNQKDIERLLNNQPNPLEVFKRYTYDEMKQILQEWLTPEEESEGYEEGEIIDDEKEEVIAPTPNKPYALKTPAAGKKSKVDKFDSLFDEEDGSQVDDLPF